MYYRYMKTLLRYILEQESLSGMVDFIKAKIDAPKDNEEIITRMYNAATGEVRAKIVSWLQEKGFSKDQIRCTISIFEEYDELGLLFNLATGSSIIEAEKILNVTEGHLLDILNAGLEAKSYKPNNDLMSELMSTQPGQKGVTVGPAEIALMVLVNNCTQNTGKNVLTNNETAETIGSDLNMDGVGVEVKGVEAMFCGQKFKPDAKTLLKNMKAYGVQINSTRDKNCPELMKLIEEPVQLKKFGEFCFGDYFPTTNYFNEWLELLGSGKIKSVQNFLLSISLWGLMEYQKSEGFNNIIIINTENKSTYPYLNIQFKGKKQTIENLYTICNGKLKVDNYIRDASRKQLPKVTYTVK